MINKPTQLLLPTTTRLVRVDGSDAALDQLLYTGPSLTTVAACTQRNTLPRGLAQLWEVELKAIHDPSVFTSTAFSETNIEV